MSVTELIGTGIGIDSTGLQNFRINLDMIPSIIFYHPASYNHCGHMDTKNIT